MPPTEIIGPLSNRRRFLKQVGAGAVCAGFLPMKPLLAQNATQTLVETKFMGQRGQVIEPAPYPDTGINLFASLSALVPSTVKTQVLRGSRIRMCNPGKMRLMVSDPRNPSYVFELPVKLIVSGPTFTVQVEGKDRLSYKLENQNDAHWFVRAFCALALDQHWIDQHWMDEVSFRVDTLLRSQAIGCGVLRPPDFEIPDSLARNLAGANTVVVELMQRLNTGPTMEMVCQRTEVIAERLDRHMKRPSLIEIWRSDWVNRDLEPGDCRAVVFANLTPGRTIDERDADFGRKKDAA